MERAPCYMVKERMEKKRDERGKKEKKKRSIMKEEIKNVYKIQKQLGSGQREIYLTIYIL